MDELMEILRDLKPETDIRPDTALVDDGILDSLDIIELVDRIAVVFQVEIDPDEIDPDNFATAEKICELIASKKK
ncbi:MAG: acyl carrier protein [Lachnospiraceae bacterium]|nr:acyl carrier protein [Lachnospiraceae bacterium]